MIILTILITVVATIVVIAFVGGQAVSPLTPAKHPIDILRSEATEEIEGLSATYITEVAEQMKGK